MKKFFVSGSLMLILTGCGVGTYSIQSGVEDAAFISFTDDAKREIVVSVDNKTYNVQTVKQKANKSGRNIRHTVLNSVKLAPGQHTVSVTLDGNKIYSRKVFLSTGETKIIKL